MEKVESSLCEVLAISPKNGKSNLQKSNLESTEANVKPFSPTLYKKRTCLDIRQDVLNKSMLRSLKKYLTNKFLDETNFNSKTPADKKKDYNPLMTQFVTKYYPESTGNFKPKYLNFKAMYAYIGVIVMPEIAKKELMDAPYRRFSQQLYQVLYNYSHGKLSNLFKNKTLRFLFEDYVNSGAANTLIETDPTLSKNKNEYLRTLYIFLDSFRAAKYTLLASGKRRFGHSSIKISPNNS